jgi:hypothetical protein
LTWHCVVALQDGRAKVQAGLLSEQLKTALTSVQSYKVLEFTTMAGAFKNFTSPGVHAGLLVSQLCSAALPVHKLFVHAAAGQYQRQGLHKK